MPDKTHHFGQLEHAYTRKHATFFLTNNASVTLSSSQASIFPFSEIFERLDLLLESRTWVAGKQRLHICFHVILDRIHLRCDDQALLAEKLGKVLCHGEPWGQLGFDISFGTVECGDDGVEENIKISLILTPHHGLGNVEDELNRLAIFWHVHPPPGIPVVILERLDFWCNLSRTSNALLNVASTDYKKFLEIEKYMWEIQALGRRRRRKPLNNPPHLAAYALDEDHRGDVGLIMTARAPSTFVEQELLDIFEVDPEQDTQTSTCFGSRLNGPDSLDGSSSYTSSAILTPTSGLSSQSSASFSLRSCSVQALSPANFLSHLEPSSFDDLIELIDLSLRGFLFGQQLFDKRGIAKSDAKEYPTLCRFSPALFSPGYPKIRPVFARRADGITAGSLSKNYLHCHNREFLIPDISSGPVSQTQEYTAAESHNFQQPDQDGADLKRAIEARLWFLMQVKMFDPLASKAVKSCTASRAAQDSPSSFHVLIDDEAMGDDEVDGNELLDNNDNFDLLLEDERIRSGDFHLENPAEYEAGGEDTLLDSQETGIVWAAETLFDNPNDPDEALFWPDLDAETHTLDRQESPFEDLLECSMLDPGEADYSQGHRMGQWSNVRSSFAHDDHKQNTTMSCIHDMSEDCGPWGDEAAETDSTHGRLGLDHIREGSHILLDS
ncbi:MAG: hypothetical protein Q9163_005655 [Psora crenata]